MCPISTLITNTFFFQKFAGGVLVLMVYESVVPRKCWDRGGSPSAQDTNQEDDVEIFEEHFILNKRQFSDLRIYQGSSLRSGCL